MLIQVTAEHIAKGNRRSGTSCMVALALRDAGVMFSWCCPNGIFAKPGPDELIYYDAQLDAKMRAFDDGAHVEPFSFVIPEDKP
jgi:hypothetical protein